MRWGGSVDALYRFSCLFGAARNHHRVVYVSNQCVAQEGRRSKGYMGVGKSLLTE